MKNRLLLLSVTSLCLLVLSGCGTIRGQKGVDEYNADPLTMNVPTGISSQQVQDAMVATFEGRQWTVTSSTPDRVEASLDHSWFKAKVVMVREGNVIKILNYSTKENAKTGGYDAAVPHGWLENLQADFPRRLLQSY